MDFHSQPISLAGKVLVVIGGTTGLGLSGACAFVAAGARVVVVGLDSENTENAASRFGDAGRSICADATRPETTPAAIQEAVKVFDGFDGLYHVAGGSGRRWGDGPLHELSDDAWRSTLELNLSSVMYSNRAAVQYWLNKGSGGTILNMASVLANSPSSKYFATHAYATAKSGIIGLTRSAAAAYAPHNIRFNAVAPGLVATPMSRRAQSDQAILDFIQTKQPLDGGRMGTPQDLDAAAIYFMSDASRFATGQVLTVDGGWSLADGQIPSYSQP